MFTSQQENGTAMHSERLCSDWLNLWGYILSLGDNSQAYGAFNSETLKILDFLVISRILSEKILIFSKVAVRSPTRLASNF